MTPVNSGSSPARGGPIAEAMTTPDRANQYLRTRVMTASPAELRLLLLDGALKFLTQGIEGLEAKDYERSYSGFSQCRAIISELLQGVRDEVDPDLGERVRGLYTFMFNELVSASMEKDVAKAKVVVELLEYERETWVLAMEQLRAEGIEPSATPQPAADTPPAAPTPGNYKSVSFSA